MKKLVVLFLVVSTLGIGDAFSQMHGVKINPFSAIVRTGWVAYEYSFNENMSAQAAVFYTGWSSDRISDNDNDIRLNGFGFMPEFRYYVTGEAPHGFYIGPYMQYRNYTFKEKDDIDGDGVVDKAAVNLFGGGGVLGYQALLGDVVTLDEWFGFGYGIASLTTNDDDIQPIGFLSNGGPRFRLGMTIGVAF